MSESSSDLNLEGVRFAVFDVCGTLYYSNTTFDFIQFYLESKGKSIKAGVLKIARLRFFSVIFICISRLVGFDLSRWACLRLLKGERMFDLTSSSKAFVENILIQNKNNHAHTQMKICKEKGLEIILMSASVDVVISDIAIYLDVKHFSSSELSFDGQVCTGRLEKDLTGKKLMAVNRCIDKEAGFVVFTDNLSDIDLVRSANQSCIYYHGTGKRRAWSRLLDDENVLFRGR